jgi:hypothetical protein
VKKQEVESLESIARLLVLIAKGPPPDRALSQAQQTVQEFCRDTLEVAGIDWRRS